MSIRPLTKELQAKTKAELYEDPKWVQEDLKSIKAWLEKQRHIKTKTEDQWLLTFLRGCKFDLERAKEKIDMYYTVRTIVPEFFDNRDTLFPEIQEILRLGIFLPLKNVKGRDTSTTILFRTAAYDPAKINITDLLKVFLMISDILLHEDDQYLISGVVVLQDMKDITRAHISALTPNFAKKTTTVFQEAYPVRSKAIHYWNAPSFLETALNIFRPLMKDKLFKRMIIHSSNNLDKLYKTVPKSILPSEYGGEGGTIQELTRQWRTKVEGYREWFLSEAKYGTVESKRLSTPKTANHLFGLEGSFRKLNL